VEKKYILSSFIYGLLGLVLGIYMAATKNHGQMVTHAHVMLLGFVVSFIYGVSFKLWIKNTSSKLAVLQFTLHQVGTLGLLTGLFLLYGQQIVAEKLTVLLSSSSIVVLIAMILMLIQFVSEKEFLKSKT